MLEQRFQPGDEPVPGFMLRKFLGKGNFGEVWETRAAGDVKVAMKILSEIDRKSGRKAFKALQLVKNLSHPHLVKIVGFWLKDEQGNLLDDVVDPHFSEDSSVAGLAHIPQSSDADLAKTMNMEDFLPPDTVRETPNTADRPAQLFIAIGLAEETLDQCLRRHQKQRAAAGQAARDTKQLNGIPREELLRYLEGAAKGLDFLNIDHNIQHGDVKPANIMIISGEGQVSDFDLARTIVDLKSTTTKVGTLAYMAPEVCTDGVPRPTSDQYALAITYYEMRTGKLPYTKETAPVVIQEKVTGRLNLSLLPKSERKIIRRATLTEPEARYESCGAMIRELQRPRVNWQRVLGRTAAVLVLLCGLLAAWQFALPAPYRASDIWIRFMPHSGPTVALRDTEEFKEIQQTYRDVEALETNPQTPLTGEQLLEIRSAIDAISYLANNHSAEDCQPLVEPNRRFVNLLCDRSTEVIQLDGELAERQLSDLLGHIEETREFDHDAVMCDQWRAITQLSICRVSLPKAEKLRLVQQTIRELPAHNAAVWSEHQQQQPAFYATQGILARAAGSDVLSATVLEPLAWLVTNNRGQEGLTPWERREVSQLISDVKTEYLRNSNMRTFGDRETNWLTSITGLDVDQKKLLLLSSRVAGQSASQRRFCRSEGEDRRCRQLHEVKELRAGRCRIRTPA